jgi:phosphoribosylamine---glycine ligase
VRAADIFRSMRILVVGGGGREHALVWKLAQSSQVEKIWCAPGNGGISDEAECVAVDAGDLAALANLAERAQVDLTVVGPELPLVRGMADAFSKRGLLLLGPSQAAAELEGSKIFAKQFMQRHGVPTAALQGIFDSRDSAGRALAKLDRPVVIKADGLCGGKGVLVTASRSEAEAFLDQLMVAQEYGQSGARVLLEEAISGPEISLIVLTDGERFAEMAPARDYKRAYDADAGPNTGGMGAISSDALLSRELARRIRETIVIPTLRGMEAEGRRYCGFLYFGLMLTADGPQVLEFNCRLGDPETEAMVARMDFDLAEVLLNCAAGRLRSSAVAWKANATVCVVMAAEGYPGAVRKGDLIEGLSEAGKLPGAKVFHAGTRKEGGKYYTSSGRVLAVTAEGRDLAVARERAYEAIKRLHFRREHHRTDIGRPLVGGEGKGATSQPSASRNISAAAR